MARPTKYQFKDAANLPIKCVYVFLDNGIPVYVGKTLNAKKRFEPYRLHACHNQKLNGWLKEKSGDFTVEIYQPENIDSFEVDLIKLNKPTLFNISHGNETDWYLQNRKQKPWVAGRGILSPISEMLRCSDSKERKDAIRKYLNSMSDKERCRHEIGLAMLKPATFKRWLDLTTDKMIACLEAS